jgi:hypothetical protein
MKPKPPKDLWEQMDAAIGVELREQMEGYSAMEYARRHGVDPATARRRLEDAAKAGKIIQGWHKDSRNWIKVYRPK